MWASIRSASLADARTPGPSGICLPARPGPIYLSRKRVSLVLMALSLPAAINRRRRSRPSAGCSFTLICTFRPLISILLTSRVIFTTDAAFYSDTAVKYTFKPAKLYLIKSLCNCSSTGIESLKPQSFFFGPPLLHPGRDGGAAELIKKRMSNIPI